MLLVNYNLPRRPNDEAIERAGRIGGRGDDLVSGRTIPAESGRRCELVVGLASPHPHTAHDAQYARRADCTY